MSTTKKTKATGLTPKDARSQEALLKTLTAKAKHHVARVRTYFHKADRAGLEQFDLGRDIKALYDYRTKNGTGHYGLRFIANLCDVFGWDKGVVYGALRVVRVFTSEQIALLRKTPLKSGRLMPFGHLRLLAKVKLTKIREKLFKKAISGSWTRDELQGAIDRETTGQKQADGRGRPLKTPKDLAGVVRQQNRVAQEFIERSANVWETGPSSLLGTTQKMLANDISADKVKLLRDHAAFLHKLVEKAETQAFQAEEAADFLQNRLAKAEERERAKGSAAATTDGANAGTAKPNAA